MAGLVLAGSALLLLANLTKADSGCQLQGPGMSCGRDGFWDAPGLVSFCQCLFDAAKKVSCFDPVILTAASDRFHSDVVFFNKLRNITCMREVAETCFNNAMSYFP
jgi:hypothetical protein